jgi:hypothetical protein
MAPALRVGPDFIGQDKTAQHQKNSPTPDPVSLLVSRAVVLLPADKRPTVPVIVLGPVFPRRTLLRLTRCACAVAVVKDGPPAIVG